VGSHVHLEADGLTDGYWKQVGRTDGGAYGVFLIRSDGATGCELIAGGRFSLDISPSGSLVADFVVPDTGDCFQSQAQQPVEPGRYAIGIGCHACEIAYFRVTPG
jgi:hypothetical protein